MNIEDAKIAEFLQNNKELLESIRPDVFVEAAASVNAEIWTRCYRMIKGKPMTYVSYDNPHFHRPFLIMPLTSDAKHKTALKPRQIGFSDVNLNECLFNCDTKPGTKWIYTFPRDTQLRTFSTTRIDPAIEESPRIAAKVSQSNVYQKRIGSSFIVLRSAWDVELGEGVDADGLYLDERDRMRGNVEHAFRESLSSSPYQYVREISTPTIPNRGVHASFLKSTQYFWFVKCEKCGYRQLIDRSSIVELKPVPLGAQDFPDGSYDFRCKRCKDGTINRWEGEWVARFPGREIAGWALNQGMCVWISADEIMRKKIRYKHEDIWMRYVWGMPFSGGGGLARKEHFLGCMADDTYRTFCEGRPRKGIRYVSVGIDWGHLNWVVVYGHSVTGQVYLLNLSVFEDTNEPLEQVYRIIEWLNAHWKPEIIVADWGYGKDRNPALAKAFPGRFWACRYPNSDETSVVVEPQWNQPDYRVTVHRSTALRQTAYEYRAKRVIIPRPLDIEYIEPQLKIFIEHFSNAQVVRDEEDDGSIIETVESGGDDHYLHAATYARIGMDKIASKTPASFSLI